jgi:hypothetical protein
MKKKSRFLQTPVEPFVVEPELTADEILARMERISFRVAIWRRPAGSGRRCWATM